ncbi:branched-chain amino acid transporter permease [Eggerthia catenaformis]|uniref:branched-chain amino acid transporter permease n=1 Tax=Eggerthia catenaformis TaxID=31973 RepID=UPI00047E3FEA|nr:AzlD domain-containing protein [Eggerthia catenaformis]
MTFTQRIITIIIIISGTLITRFLPYIIFRKKTPEYITYIGNMLPGALFGLLVVYCLKDVTLITLLPTLISIIFVCILYLYKKNMLLSIIGGTALYMILIQTLFN